MRLIFDHEGTLWAATYGGISRFDGATGNFITYTPEKKNTIQYQEIKEDGKGALWLGAQSGLHRFDPRTGQFTIYEHDPNDPGSLSDNRVNSVHFDRFGNMWVGTQNGLDKFDPSTGTVKAYYERDGLAGDVVSCILEDKRGLLWMGTNNGLSSFDPQSQRFQNFSVADGLPGPDLTGWGACYQGSKRGDVLRRFQRRHGLLSQPDCEQFIYSEDSLDGLSAVGKPGSDWFQVAAQAIHNPTSMPSHCRTSRISFSIEFSALSYFNAETNRYRYRLDRLDNRWHEVGSDQRTASYTTLPALIPLVRDEVHRIACEAVRNAFRHAQAGRIEVEIRYERRLLRLWSRTTERAWIRRLLLKAGAPDTSGRHAGTRQTCGASWLSSVDLISVRRSS
jgi:Y_Y_Y domain/Two component regulator propeller